MFASVMDTIALKEMIEKMDKGEIFSIGVRTCNLTQDTGGEWIEIEMATKNRDDLENVEKRDPGGITGVRRNPNHFKNSTRNIRVLPEGNIMKIHLRLVRKFNGKTVI